MNTVRWLMLLAAFFSIRVAAAKNLEIYIIDVEGGKSVLFVSPSGESMLFDAGWPAGNGRASSTERIVEAARAAMLKQIDYLVVSHFDVDHMGDVPELVAKFPVRHLLDHGRIPTPAPDARGGATQRIAAYRAVREKLGAIVLKPGDKVPIKGVEVRVIAAAGALIRKPLRNAGSKNALCDTYKQAAAIERDAEDDRSIGLLITYGKFRMADLADLEAHLSHDLVCPDNLIGTVDVYNLNVHGQFKGVAPEMVSALRAPVIIQANGARKGADAQTWPVLRAAAGLQDIWQLHESLNAGKEANPPADFLANVEPTDTFKWLKISAESNGAFTVTNSRTGFTKRYRQ
jgi:competence protein ComEC